MNKFFIYVAAIALVYLGQMFFKIKQTRKSGEFDWKVLFSGLLDHCIFFVGVLCIFASGLLLPEVKVAIIDGVEMALPDALLFLAMALYIRQSVKALQNIKENYEIENVKSIEERALEDTEGRG